MSIRKFTVGIVSLRTEEKTDFRFFHRKHWCQFGRKSVYKNLNHNLYRYTESVTPATD
jgi:hypothetical protein